jgi:NTE family protein
MNQAAGFNFGLALSGGGVRTVAQVGIIEVMLESGIRPNIVSGTSGGAIVAALLAAGNSPSQMMNFFTSTSFFHWSKFAMSKAGLLDPEKFIEAFLKFVPYENFEELPIPLRVVTTDLLAGEERVIETGSIVMAVLASAAFPGVFEPVKIDNRPHVDGGIFNNIPANIIRKSCKYLIGIDVNPLVAVQEKDIQTAVSVIKRSFELMSRYQTIQAKENCDLYITPEGTDQYSLFDIQRAKELYLLGKKEGKKYQQRFQSLAQLVAPN